MLFAMPDAATFARQQKVCCCCTPQAQLRKALDMMPMFRYAATRLRYAAAPAQ